MADVSMRDFWDERAREDPFFFVDNRLSYGTPDLEFFWEGGREAVDGILGKLGVKVVDSDVVVDLGCGVGRATRVLAERGAAVKAIDISERMLEVAREENSHLDNVEWIRGDGTSLAGIETASADCLFEFVVFHHIPDEEVTYGYIGEIGRVLRSGGWAALQVSNEPWWHARRGLGRRAKDWFGRIGRTGPKGQNHPAWRGSSVDLDRLGQVAAVAGMEVERVVGEGTIYCLVLLRRRV